MKVRKLLAVLSTAALTLTVAGPAATATPHRTDVVAEWFDVTANALARFNDHAHPVGAVVTRVRTPNLRAGQDSSTSVVIETPGRKRSRI